jgi:Ca2+-binding EF-hand superfamily protein
MHRMEFKQFQEVAAVHLSSRLSESAISELFFSGLDMNGDGCVDGNEWLLVLGKKMNRGTFECDSQQFRCASAPSMTNQSQASTKLSYGCGSKIDVGGSGDALLELLSASEMTLEEGFCAFAFGEGDGDFDPMHCMEFKQFHEVAAVHLSSRLSESAISELFFSGLDMNGDGCVDGNEWIHFLRARLQSPSHTVGSPTTGLSSSSRLPQPSRGCQMRLSGSSPRFVQGGTREFIVDTHSPQSSSDSREIPAVSTERHRCTPMQLDDLQLTREDAQAYLDVCALVRMCCVLLH